MGLYVGKVVSALVADIIMPIPCAFIPGGDWRGAVFTIPIGKECPSRWVTFNVMIEFQ
jgi:large conductance mechanosensitive channel